MKSQMKFSFVGCFKENGCSLVHIAIAYAVTDVLAAASVYSASSADDDDVDASQMSHGK